MTLSLFFTILTTVLNILWIIAVGWTFYVTKNDGKAYNFNFIGSMLIYTMLMNLVEIWKK